MPHDHVRKLPVVLPYELVVFLCEEGLLPPVEAGAVPRYWQHMSQHAEWATHCHDWTKTHPMFLWGDDAQYNKQRSKVVAVACGFILDDRKLSSQTVFPLFCYKVEPLL